MHCQPCGSWLENWRAFALFLQDAHLHHPLRINTRFASRDRGGAQITKTEVPASRQDVGPEGLRGDGDDFLLRKFQSSWPAGGAERLLLLDNGGPKSKAGDLICTHR